jgi:hypothetical protein
MVIILESVNGKKLERIDNAPITPKTANATMKIFTATGNFIKNAIIFLIYP